jgi:two-component system, CitB family, sensor kinase
VRLRRLPLARQLLVLQIALIVLVLGVVVAITYAQSTSDFRRSTGNRVLGLAETFATDSLARSGLRGDIPEGAIASVAARVQSVSGVDFVAVLDRDGTVIASQDPDHLGEMWNFGTSDVRTGRAWVGPTDLSDGSSAIEAHVPILDPTNRQRLGYAVIGQYSPSIGDRLTAAVPDLLIYLGVASALGVAGSVLLARRIKRQTLGLEPRDIAGLMEHREALLHGIKEGVLGLDLDQRITIVNAEAQQLLDLPDDSVGQRITDVGLTPTAVQALTHQHSGTDHVLDTSARIVVLNRMPVVTNDSVIGSVVTLRDRTELWGLRQELDTTRHTADALRAQTHEFSNRLHTIAGLLRLGKLERAQRYVTDLQTGHNQFLKSVTSRIDDQTLAALVVAKGSLASERGVELVIADDTQVGVLPLDLAATLETVIGNFVDNALDACAGIDRSQVVLTIIGDDEQLVVEVRDNGPGVDPSLIGTIFTRGVSTKSPDRTRGIGLALARAVCEQRGGHVEVRNEDGAVFTAVIPRAQRAQRDLSAQR